MRCTANPTRLCPMAEACEIVGCLQPYGPAVLPALPRKPIDLGYRPGWFARRLLALTGKRDPTPIAPRITQEPFMSQTFTPAEPPAPPAAARPPLPPPPPAPPAPLAPEWKIFVIPNGWVVYAGEKPVAVASDPAGLGAIMAGLVKR